MKKLILGLAIGVVLGSAIAAWTQVYPIRWDDAEAGLVRGVTPDSLVVADGIMLTKHTVEPFVCDGAHDGVVIFVENASGVIDDLCICQSDAWSQVSTNGAPCFSG